MPLPSSSNANRYITEAETALQAVRTEVFGTYATDGLAKAAAQRAILASIEAEAAIRRLQFTLSRSEDAVDSD